MTLEDCRDHVDLLEEKKGSKKKEGGKNKHRERQSHI